MVTSPGPRQGRPTAYAACAPTPAMMVMSTYREKNTCHCPAVWLTELSYVFLDGEEARVERHAEDTDVGHPASPGAPHGEADELRDDL